MNNPITENSKAIADEGRMASEELVKSRHAIIAEVSQLTRENTRLRSLIRKTASALNERASKSRSEAERINSGWLCTFTNGRASGFEQAETMVLAILREV